jgi:hypothetical protein
MQPSSYEKSRKNLDNTSIVVCSYTSGERRKGNKELEQGMTL